MNTFRGGMQMHAVPEEQRAFDSSGRRLPWGYDYADAELSSRRIPDERGPFGKSKTRQTRSKSRTATPGPKEASVNTENQRYIDDIFSTYKSEQAKKEPRATAQQQVTRTTDQPPPSQPSSLKEPIEVILYGYSSTDDLYEVLNTFERISEGTICEDYDRQPPPHRPRYNTALSTHSYASPRSSLSKAARAKAYQYAGGQHWIKVTFDSPEAAERACHFSPHVVFGHQVFAEPYRGVGPTAGDLPFPVTAADRFNTLPSLRNRLRGQQSAQQHASLARSTTTSALPFNTNTNNDPFTSQSRSPESSETASSATATGTSAVPVLPRSRSDFALASNPFNPYPSIVDTQTPTSSRLATNNFHHSQKQPPPRQQESQQQRPLRIPGAKRAVLHPAELALLPVPPWYQRTLGTWPVMTWFLGSGELIGKVPRKPDGSFDAENASVYWRFWRWVDAVIGTDVCGLKED